MVAHWPLDEGAGTVVHDVVGGNDGEMVGLDPAEAWITDGALGGAVSFDGEFDHHIEVPHSESIEFGDVDFSVSCWIRYPEGVDPVADSIMNGWVTKGTNGAGGTTGKRYQLFIDDGGGVRFTIDDDVVKTRVEVHRAPFMTGDWVFVVGLRDTFKGELRIYADCVLQGTAVDNTGDISNGEALRIGDLVSEEGPMYGDIDDVRIFEKALNEDDIAMVYSGIGD
jgi:hypothetical protein